MGLVRLKEFFQRMHPPALASTLGTWCVALASIISFSLHDAQIDTAGVADQHPALDHGARDHRAARWSGAIPRATTLAVAARLAADSPVPVGTDETFEPA